MSSRPSRRQVITPDEKDSDNDDDPAPVASGSDAGQASDHAERDGHIQPSHCEEAGRRSNLHLLSAQAEIASRGKVSMSVVSS